MKEKPHSKPKPKKLQKTSSDFCVVGVGASAGGLEAFQAFLGAIPEGSGMAYVLVQHLDPNHVSKLPEILQRATSLPVKEINDDVEVEPNHVYIIPSNKMLMANDGMLELSPRPTRNETSLNMPIDLFLGTLAEVYMSHAIGVVLSGNGSDGSQGLKAIKDHGGFTFAQDSESAAHDGMPKSAVDTGMVDFVLKPEEMPKKILEVTCTVNKGDVQDKSRKKKDKDEMPADAEWEKAEGEIFQNILALLRIRKETDFTYYKQSTIRRRILRRVALVDKEGPVEYLEYLRKNKEEQDKLYQDLLIPVTSFFRDTKIFKNLCTSVIPDIIDKKPGSQDIRIWSAGCSTGEEVYSIAICLLEHLEKSPATRLKREEHKIQIFGTDISDPAIVKARAGIYKKNELEGLSAERLDKFFTKIDDRYQIKKIVRELCIFARHNFLKDPPFGKLNLLSCRNVLIYMEPYLQKKALTTFHYALREKGFLLLGKSETISSVPELFTVVEKHDKLFSRKDKKGVFMAVASKRKEEDFRHVNHGEKTETKRTNFQKTADDIILNNYTPSGVVVNEAMEIVHFRGNTGKYLEQSSGKPTHNLLKLAKMGLSFELRNILHKVKTQSNISPNGSPRGETKQGSSQLNSVIKKNIPIEVYGRQHYIDIEAIPMKDLVEPHYLLLFHDRRIAKTKIEKPLKLDKEKDVSIHQLEQELSQAREDMRGITEEQEASNEELQSANEELQSSNEEMQSLNEELETSKEELQSTNEELVVVNQELVNLNKHVSLARNYAMDVFATIREPLLVLDQNFNVKTANQAFYKKFKVKESETVEKTIFELGNNQWEIPDLRNLLVNIIHKNTGFEDFEITREFPGIGLRTMILNGSEVIRAEGGEKLILLVFEDVTEKRFTEKNLDLSEYQFKILVETIPQLIWISDTIGNVEFYNAKWEQYTGKKFDKPVENQWLEHIHPEDAPAVLKNWKNSLKNGESFTMEYRIKGAKGKYCWFLAKALPFSNSENKIIKWFSSHTDIETQKEAEETLRKSEGHFRELANLIPEKVSHADKDGKVTYYNQSWLEYTGLSSQELIEEGWGKFVHPDEENKVVEKWMQSIKTGEALEVEMRVKNKNGIYKWHISRAVAVKNEEGEIKLWIAATTEIQKIKEEEKRKEDFLKMVSHELKTPITSIKGYVQLLLAMIDQKKEIQLSSFPLESSLLRIDNQVSKLTRLIAEMLDLSRIEEGKLDLQKSTFSLNGLINETIDDIKYTDTQHNIKIVHDFKCDINADKDRIGQVLINFVTNAIKYSPDNKEIEIRIHETREKQVAVSVRDYGIGIAEKDHKEIFNRFHRVAGKNEDTYSGLGIGLFLAHEIIQRHNGIINVESELEKGSVFSFVLPYEK